VRRNNDEQGFESPDQKKLPNPALQSQLKTQNSKLKTHNSKPETRKPETQNYQLKTMA
jgi:hypothetical protein